MSQASKAASHGSLSSTSIVSGESKAAVFREACLPRGWGMVEDFGGQVGETSRNDYSGRLSAGEPGQTARFALEFAGTSVDLTSDIVNRLERG